MGRRNDRTATSFDFTVSAERRRLSRSPLQAESTSSAPTHKTEPALQQQFKIARRIRWVESLWKVLVLLPMTALVLMGQTPQYFQSALDGKAYEVRQLDESTLVIYAADGSMAASLSRKKASDKFEGETLQLAPQCPGGKGKFEVAEMTDNRIRVRAEKPSSAVVNGRHPCMMPMLNSWNTFDLVRRQAPTQQTAQISQSGQGKPQQPQIEERPSEGAPRQAPAPSQPQAGGKSPGAPAQHGDLAMDQKGNATPVASNDDAATRIAAAAARPSAHEELVFHTFLPNSDLINYRQIQLDEAGNVYVAFVCKGFPGVAKLDKSGRFFHFRTALIPNGVPQDFCTPESRWTQNSPEAEVTALALAKDGRIFVAGFLKNARGFPTKNAARPAPPERSADGRAINYGMEGFLARLSADGRTVEYATLWGGVEADLINAIAVDDTGGVWTAGQTQSKDFPRISSLYDYQGGWDAFVTYFDSNGKPRFSTTMGTKTDDRATAIALDKHGSVVFAGQTGQDVSSWGWYHVLGVAKGSEFPLLGATGYVETNSGGFIARISRDTHQIEYSAYLGNKDGQFTGAYPRSIAIDELGRVVLVGSASDGDPIFPFRDPLDLGRDPNKRGWFYSRQARAAQSGENGYDGATGAQFILRFAPDLRTVELSRLLNASGSTGYNSPDIVFEQLAVRGRGEIYVAGLTMFLWKLPGFPTMRRGKEGDQGVLLKYDADGTPVWSTSLGGLNEVKPDYQGWDGQNHAWSVSVSSTEVAVLAKTVQPLAPTTKDAMIGEGTKEGGLVLAKYRTSSEDEKACEVSTRPLILYTTNQGGQDFNPWVVANRADCKWKVSSPDSWIKVQPRDVAQGIGLLKVDIESNYDDHRTGKILITVEDGKSYELQVIQSTKPMQVTVSRNLVEISSKNASKASIDVKGEANSEWAIATDANWVRIDGPTTRTGPGQVTIRTLPNATGAPRSAFVTVGSQRVSVVQGIEDTPGTDTVPPKAGAPPKAEAAKPPAPKPIQGVVLPVK